MFKVIRFLQDGKLVDIKSGMLVLVIFLSLKRISADSPYISFLIFIPCFRYQGFLFFALQTLRTVGDVGHTANDSPK